MVQIAARMADNEYVMNRLFAPCLLALLLLPPVISHAEDLIAAPKWAALPDMPVGVLAASVSHIGDKVIITGGIHQLGSALNKAQIFDLRERKWLEPMKLATGRMLHAQVALDDSRILLVGGQTGTVKPLGDGLTATASCEILDLRTGISKEIAPLPRAVAEPTAHRLPDGRAIVIGGESALIFDPKTNKWAKGIGLRDDRLAHASAVLADGRVIVIGGLSRHTMEIIDPVAGTSKELSAQLPHELDDTRIAVLPGNRVWIIGGQHSKTGLTVEQTWILDLNDPRKSTLTAGPKLDLPKGMADMSIVQVGPYIIVAGGESEFSGGDVELHTARLLDTRTLTVRKLPDSAHPHDDAVAIATERGIIIFGGFVETKMTLPFSGSTKQFSVPQAVVAVEELLIK